MYCGCTVVVLSVFSFVTMQNDGPSSHQYLLGIGRSMHMQLQGTMKLRIPIKRFVTSKPVNADVY